jgi:DNA topoisomerase-1
MADAAGTTVSVRSAPRPSERRPRDCEFAASGTTITFRRLPPGLRREHRRPRGRDEEKEALLPPLTVGRPGAGRSLRPVGHTTVPPARYTEASLVKKLEELGIGRPSTWASSCRPCRTAVRVEEGPGPRPNWTAFAVVALMEKHFDELVDYAFTARSRGPRLHRPQRAQKSGLAQALLLRDDTDEAPGPQEAGCREPREHRCRRDQHIRIGKDPTATRSSSSPGKYGPYVKRGDDTGRCPTTLPPDEVTVEKALALLSAPKGDTPIGIDPVSGLNVYVKPLFSTMKPETTTLEQALKLLTLPRTVGAADDGEPITAQNGRYGPYLSKGKESRNLGADAEERLLTITLAEAIDIFKQPKQFRGRGQPKPPLASWKNPAGGPDLIMKEGRFGFYVTDGETNASLRKGDDPSELNAERAIELLQQRREYLATPEGQAKAAARGAKKAKKSAKAKKATKTPAPVAEGVEPTKSGKSKKAAAAKKPAATKLSAEKKAPAPKKAAAKAKKGEKKVRPAQ